MSDNMTDRWVVEIRYFDGKETILAVEELEQIQEAIEHGPDWNTIDVIEIRLNRPSLMRHSGG